MLLPSSCHHRFDVPHDCSVELSPLGYQFLTVVFENFDKDQDGALNKEELQELFSTSPGNPWAGQKFPDTTVADDTGAVTLQGWLAQWRFVKSAFLDSILGLTSCTSNDIV